jgi:hypothetical protein
VSIAFVNSGAVATGTTSLAIALPASLVAGNLLLMHIGSKYSPNLPTTPNGWTLGGQVTAGAGAAGADAGEATSTVFYKVSDGTESGNQNTTITSGNSAIGRIAQYTSTENVGWSLAFETGTDTSAGTDISIDTSGALATRNTDFVVSYMALNSDAATALSSVSLTGSGVVLGSTNRYFSVTGNGDDVAIVAHDHLCTLGLSGASLVLVGTANAGTPAGAAVFVRMRSAQPTIGTIQPEGLLKSRTLLRRRLMLRTQLLRKDSL